MNFRAALPFLALAALALSGCVTGNRPNDNRAAGDVNFTWSLAGRSCAENTHVREIRISIPGERLENGGVYACAPNGVMGIILHDFRGGTYSYTIDAVDSVGTVRFSGSGSFTVDGDVSVSANLNPRNTASFADIYWHFPHNDTYGGDPTCEQAGVVYLQVLIGGHPVETLVNGRVLTVDVRGVPTKVVPCALGQTEGGFRVELPQAGVYDLELVAMNADGYAYYDYVGSVAAFEGQTAVHEYDLVWAVGSGAVDWTFFRGAIEQTCSQAGVTSVVVNFEDADGHLLYGEYIEDGDLFRCSDYGMYNEYLPHGRLWVFVAGLNSAGEVTWLSNETNPPSIQIRAGEFCVPSLETCATNANYVEVAAYPY